VPIPSLIYIHLFFLPQFFIMLHTFHTLRRAAALLALSALPLATHAQVLEYVGSNSDSVTFSSVSPYISPDGGHFYLGENYGLVHYTRNTTTGELTFLAKYPRNTNTGFLVNGSTPQITANGNFFYLPCYIDDALTVFSRNTTTGAVTVLENHIDGQSGVDGLDGASVIALSPDEKNIYVASILEDAVTVFDRDTTTGLLTFRETFKNNVGGVTGLNYANQIKVSPNGQFVYAVGRDDTKLVTFSRNATTGALTFISAYNIPYPNSFDISSNGEFCVIGTSNDTSIHILSFNQTTGVPSAFQVIKEGVNGISGVFYTTSRSVRFSPDFTYLYVATDANPNARLLVFVRNTLNNNFSLIENKQLSTPTQRYDAGAVVSSDSRFIYNMSINTALPFNTIEIHQDTTTRVIVSVEQLGEQRENSISNVYPNPSKGAVYFDCPSINDGIALRLRLVDVLGRELYNRELVVSGGRLEADFSALPRGAYYVQLGNKTVALRLD
jgi:6-phosphogluconolactonase (cycloisomerase 2 family)